MEPGGTEGRSSGNLCCRKVLRRGASVLDIMNHLNQLKRHCTVHALYTLNTVRGSERYRTVTLFQEDVLLFGRTYYWYAVTIGMHTEMHGNITENTVQDHHGPSNLSGKGLTGIQPSLSRIWHMAVYGSQMYNVA